MPEGLKSVEEKDPEDVSEWWPAKYHKEPKVGKASWKKERDSYIRTQKEVFLKAAHERLEIYTGASAKEKKQRLAEYKLARTRYVNFVFLAEGGDAAREAEIEFAKLVGSAIKEERISRAGKILERIPEKLRRWITAGALMAGVMSVPLFVAAFGGATALAGAIAAGAVTLGLLNEFHIGLTLAKLVPGTKAKIEAYKKAESESRARGETYGQFQANNPVIVSDYQKTLDRADKYERWSKKTQTMVVGALAGVAVLAL